MQYVVKNGENIYGLALKLYGDSTYCVRLIIDNPVLQNIDNQNITGIEIHYDETVKRPVKYNLLVSNSIIPNVDLSYTIKQGQSIYDLAITYGYGVEEIVQFIQDSELVNVNSVDVSGKIIHVTKKQTSVSDAIILQNKTLATNIGVTVFGTEDLTTIFISEDGKTEFTFES